MAKKAKRKVSQVVTTAPTAEMEAVETPTTPVMPTTPRTTFSRRTSTSTEFNPDYTYVVKDLKRIGALAGTFFVLLIVLSFIIR